MANSLTGNPIVVDTAGAGTLLLTRFEVVRIRWVSAGASAGDTVSVQDQHGNVKFASVAAGANYVESEGWHYNSPLVFDGLKVPTLSSGTVYIYVRGKVPA
jgi:hypothetical protein